MRWTVTLQAIKRVQRCRWVFLTFSEGNKIKHKMPQIFSTGTCLQRCYPLIRRLIFLTRCLEKLDAAMALFHRLSSKVIIKCGFCLGKQMIDKQNLILFYMGLRHTLLGSIYIINIVISIQQQFLDDIGSIHIKVHIEVVYYDTDDIYCVYTDFQVAL